MGPQQMKDDIFYIQGTDTDYDIFRGGPDTDTILGSNGDDTIRVHRFTGEDTVEAIDGGEGFDVIAGTDGVDIIDLTGTTLTVSIISASCFPGSNWLSVC